MSTLSNYLFLFCFVILLVGCTNKTEQKNSIYSTDFLTYSGNNLSIKYPADWTFEEVGKSPLLGYITNFYPTKSGAERYPKVQVVKIVKSKFQDLNELTTWQENQAINFSRGEIIESSKTFLDGNLAHKIVYISSYDGKNDPETMTIYSLKNGNVYKITYFALKNSYSDNLELIEEMIDSFQIQ